MDYLTRNLTPEEAIVICGTAARPICFSDDADGFVWGKGSLFLLNYKGQVFGVTAKHVIEKQGANVHHTRILMNNTRVALTIKYAFIPNFDTHEYKDEIEDLLFFVIDDSRFIKESGLDLYSWNFETGCYPASELEVGAELLVAGFPFTDDRFDYDNKIINDLMLIRTANLVADSIGKDIYTIKGHPSDVSFNGLSGAPVFCRREGVVFFCGIVIRGTASSGLLRFIGSEIIYSSLNLYFSQKTSLK